MFETIILATDLSPVWDEIVACAGELKALGCVRVILTHVTGVKFLMGMEGKLAAEAKAGLEKQAAQLEAQGFQVSIELRQGLPAYSLNEVARCCGADLIVVGSHGKQEGILGSVSSAIVHHATTPILLLPMDLKPEKPQGRCRLTCTELLRHILFPSDFSKISDRALEYVVGLAPKGVGQVTLLNALDVPLHETYPPGYREWAEDAARDLLEQWQKRLTQAGLSRVEAVFDPGHPLPAILAITEKQDISLIIMGTQGRGFIQELFLGSVAHNVCRLAPCPVLLIPPASR
jgi:nucleotide-binding universal stress UspA family protein|uniref:Universal stress protein n=1 Tax=Desulfobacca acetoxidans TaxID=60893 RepID=A0A7V6DPD4_9BACT